MSYLKSLMYVLTKYTDSIKSKFLELIHVGQPLSRIEKIDIKLRVIVVYSRGISAPIKYKFEDIVKDAAMIVSLSAEQASWVGYYYAMYDGGELRNSGKVKISPTDFDFSSNDYGKRYNLVSQDRFGNIVYFDRFASLTHSRSAIAIVTNRNLIRHFCPMQACYVGMLAGMYAAREPKRRLSGQKNLLRVIK